MIRKWQLDVLVMDKWIAQWSKTNTFAVTPLKEIFFLRSGAEKLNLGSGRLLFGGGLEILIRSVF